MMPFSVSYELCFLNITLTFEFVIHPTDNRLAFNFGAYMTSVRVMGTSGISSEGLDTMAMRIVPRWLAVKESPLAVLMVTGGISLSDWNSSRFLER